MSLKIFHICFITLSTLLAAACSWWAFTYEVSPAFGSASGIVAAMMPVYGVWFWKKTKKIIL